MTIISLKDLQHETRFQKVWRNLAGLLGLSQEERDQTQIKMMNLSYDVEKDTSVQYAITLPRPVSSNVTDIKPAQPGCKPIPPGATKFILRFLNQRPKGVNLDMVIEHEVAMLALLSDALSHFQPSPVPRVFAWRSAVDGQGWVLREYMPGEPLRDCLEEDNGDFSKTQTGKVREQIAMIIKSLQDYHLPAGITGLGGVTFDKDGVIVSAPRAYDGAGPWDSFESLLSYQLTNFLAQSYANPDYDGWRERGLRTRIRRFLNEGLPKHLASLTSKQERSIVHTCLTYNDILCDLNTGCITGLLGNRSAHISHPLAEFLENLHLTSFHYLTETIPYDEEMETYTDEKKMYTFYSPIPGYAGVPESERTLKRWEEELEERGAKHPRAIEGASGVAEIYAVLSEMTIQDNCSNKEWAIRNDEEDIGRKLKYLGF